MRNARSPRAGARGRLLVTAALAAACGPASVSSPQGDTEPAGVLEEPVVIGRRDLVVVDDDGKNVPPRYRALLGAVGVLEPTGCTATHVGAGRVVTAGHCVGSASDHCEELTVRWRPPAGGQASGLTSTCTRVVATEWGRDRDVAIFEVDAAPEVSVAIDPCLEPELGARVTIFGHPRGAPLAWAGRCTIEPAALAGRGGDAFSHACDTEAGMSGAAIIDDATLRVVGVHGGGRGRWNFATFATAAPLSGALANPPCSCANAGAANL